MLLPPYGENKLDCSGCTACQHACPENSITMEIDDEGFLYPVVNSDTCTSCGVCSDVCPIINPQENKQRMDTPDVYGAWNLDNEIRRQSSSGGIFSVFANEILKRNGVVFGAGFDDEMRLRHIGVESSEELATLRGSKYLESHLNETFKQVEALIKQGRYVLFTGVPCQIAGLYAYLQQDYRTLYTSDLFCHGVPSPKVFNKHVKNVERKERSTVTDYQFRSKQYGWRPYGIQINFANGRVQHMPGNLDPYTVGFLQDTFLRPICSVCPFKTTKRVADISVGDFWRVGKHFPELDDNQGISTLLVNTPKGRELLNACRSELFLQPCELDQVRQGALRKTTLKTLRRSDFFADLNEVPFEKVKRKYMLNQKQVARYRMGRLKRKLAKIVKVPR